MENGSWMARRLLRGCPEIVSRTPSSDPSPPSPVTQSPVFVRFFGRLQVEGGLFLPGKMEFRDSLSGSPPKWLLEPDAPPTSDPLASQKPESNRIGIKQTGLARDRGAVAGRPRHSFPGDGASFLPKPKRPASVGEQTPGVCPLAAKPPRRVGRAYRIEASGRYLNGVTPGMANGYSPSGPGITGGSASNR